MEDEIYTFIIAHVTPKPDSFITVAELFEHIPKTIRLLRNSIEDIQEEIRQSKAWTELGTKWELSRKIKNIGAYMNMSCICNQKSVFDIFYNVELDIIKNTHFIDCPCNYLTDEFLEETDI